MKQASKIDSRGDYLRAGGYHVTVKVTYLRTRLIRALDENQAMDFAEVRERKAVQNHLGKTSKFGADVDEVTSIECVSATRELPHREATGWPDDQGDE